MTRAAHATGWRDGRAFLVLVVGLLAWFATPGIVRGFAFPVGPDAPVYLWWSRLVGVEGLSSVTRPGVPALALVLAGTLRIPLPAILAGIEIAGGVLIGVGAASLLRIAAPSDRAMWLLGGALAGAFAVHIATGYLATIAFAVLFLAACAVLLEGERPVEPLAVALLGAAALAHPRFLAVGSAILLTAAALAWRSDRAEAVRLLTVVAGAGLLLAVAGAALAIGPSPLLADTSRDAFLRRAGLDAVLRSAYRSRIVARWTRYAPWGLVPLASAATRRVRGGIGRLLLAWTAVASIGALTSLVTGLLPVDRFITFAFALPMLAAVGATAIARQPRLPRPLARGIAALLATSIVVGSATAWFRQEPFLDRRDLAALRLANSVTVGAPDAVLAFPIEAAERGFLLTLSGNAFRATVPPDRIRDVVVTVIGTATGAEGGAIGDLAGEDERRAITQRSGRVQRILAGSFAAGIAREAPWIALGEDVAMDPGVVPGVARDPVEPYAPWLPLVAALGMLVVLAAAGAGWIGSVSRAWIRAPELAPAVGMGVVILIAFAVDRLGLRLSGTLGPSLVAALGILSGPILRRSRLRGGRLPRERRHHR